MRFGAVLIAVCMVLIAASVGAVLYLSFGFARAEAAVVAIAILTALAIYNSVTSRARDREDVTDQISDLSRGTADLARQVAEIGRRIANAEAMAQSANDKVLTTAEPLAAEIEVLGTLVKEVAESVAAHEAALVETTEAVEAMRAEAARGAQMGAQVRLPRADPMALTAAAPPISPSARPEPPDAIDPADLGEPPPAAEPNLEWATSGRFKGMERGQIVGLIGRAIEQNRVDLYLQPTVTLPQRKVRYYEALTRLRTEDGEVLMPAEYLGYADTAGLMPKLDNLLILRCVQVVRRLIAKNRDIGLFCNVAGSTLSDGDFFPQFLEFMDANRALSTSIVFEFTQATVRAMGPLENESLAALTALGFHFSMDRVTDLRVEPRDLAGRGFRFVKVAAPLLLNRVSPAASDIHPADFSDLLGRYGVDLIAERIESEGMVVDLLDYDVRFGQGFLFSHPRPVRADVLQGVADPEPLPAPARAEAAPARPPEPAPQPAAPARPAEPAATPVPVQAGERRSGLAQLARGIVRRSGT